MDSWQRPAAIFPTAQEILADRARRDPDRPALHWFERVLLLGRLAALVESWGSTLAPRTPAGSPIALVLSETPALVGLVLASWQAGRTAVPLAGDLADAELARRLWLSAPGLIVAHEEHLDRVRVAARGCAQEPSIFVLRGQKLSADSRAVPGKQRQTKKIGELALHAWSDSPGRAALASGLTHANVVASAIRATAARGDRPGELALVTQRPSDAGALVADILARLLAGGIVALAPRPGRDALLRAMEAGRPDVLSLDAESLDILLAESPLPARSLRSVRRVVLRTLDLPRTALRRLHERLPEAEVLRAFGYPETTGDLLLARQETLERKPDGLGLPHPGILVGAFSPEGALLGAGRTGALGFRGAVVMRGYHRNPAASREALHEGWFRTRDLGYIDDQGEVVLTAPSGAKATASVATRPRAMRKK